MIDNQEKKYKKMLSEVMITLDDNSYCFDMSLTDRIVKVKKLTKFGEQYYLFRKTIEEINQINPEMIYYITDKNAYVIGRVIINKDSKEDNLIIDCWLSKEYRNKGISHVVFDTILNEVFVVKVFDNVSNIYGSIEKALISNVNYNFIPKRKITNNGNIGSVVKVYSLK